jgi:hypothetical protein
MNSARKNQFFNATPPCLHRGARLRPGLSVQKLPLPTALLVQSFSPYSKSVLPASRWCAGSSTRKPGSDPDAKQKGNQEKCEQEEVDRRRPFVERWQIAEARLLTRSKLRPAGQFWRRRFSLPSRPRRTIFFHRLLGGLDCRLLVESFSVPGPLRSYWMD